MSFAVARTAAAMAALGLALSGCAATSTAVAKRNLDVQTKMSDTIFLDPVTPDERTVYVDVRNTSDQPALDVGAAGAPGGRGARLHRWSTTPRPPASSSRPTCSRPAAPPRRRPSRPTIRGFGGTLLGGAAGGAAGYGLGKAGLGVNDAVGTVVGALAGAAISSVADAYVQDVTYTLVTDIQVSERVPGTVISQSEQANLKQGTSGTVTQASSDTTDARRYRTRIVSTANQANLDWPQAEPELVAGLTRSIGGIF